ncbi:MULTISPECIES: hypothetical protein [unclassified Brevundimonas]|uniref:hypothetical protein n=1 Tax=unclassified Brevundimonas TaxID=2622653 RepID=UPI003F8E4E71
MSRRLDPENFVAEKLAWHQRIMHDPAVCRSAKSVASLLLHDLNPSEGGAWRGQGSMAASLDLSDRQLRRLLKQLETAAYLQIEVQKGRGRTNIYRATLPADQAEAPQKRTSTTGQIAENRTQVTAQTPKNRTSTSRKPDMGVRQFLYEPINRFPPPERRRPSSGEGKLASVDPFSQADIRETVSRLLGEGRTISYLDPAAWDADGHRIICRSSIGFTRLQELVGTALAAKGVSIAFRPREAGHMAA